MFQNVIKMSKKVDMTRAQFWPKTIKYVAYLPGMMGFDCRDELRTVGDQEWGATMVLAYSGHFELANKEQ